MTKTAVVIFAMLMCAGVARAQGGDKSISQVLDSDVTSLEGEFVPAAEAMPEDKYGYMPTGGEFKNVRSFAAQIKHVAAVNYMVGAAILGEKPPVDPLRPQSGGDDHACERDATGEESVRGQPDDEAGPGQRLRLARLRSLWADGHLSPLQRDRAAGKPRAVTRSSRDDERSAPRRVESVASGQVDTGARGGGARRRDRRDDGGVHGDRRRDADAHRICRGRSFRCAVRCPTARRTD